LINIYDMHTIKRAIHVMMTIVSVFITEIYIFLNYL